MSERQIMGIYGGYAEVEPASDMVAGKAIVLCLDSGYNPNGPPTRTAITLTEAGKNGLVKLLNEAFAEKSIEQTCMFCGGTGKVYAPTARTCNVCHGSGKL